MKSLSILYVCLDGCHFWSKLFSNKEKPFILQKFLMWLMGDVFLVYSLQLSFENLLEQFGGTSNGPYSRIGF